MKAIETVYNGYRFRSRLEARWAVFFDTLGVKYDYEPEGFDLDGVRYLPDFWLPDQDCWFEVKGQAPTEAEMRAAALLTLYRKQNVYIFFGSGIDPKSLPHTVTQYNEESGYCTCPNDFSDSSWVVSAFNQVWSECEYCKSIRIRSPRISVGAWCCENDLGSWVDSPRLIAAYTAARQARFEFGG
jgi:hypothetical protein